MLGGERPVAVLSPPASAQLCPSSRVRHLLHVTALRRREDMSRIVGQHYEITDPGAPCTLRQFTPATNKSDMAVDGAIADSRGD